MNINRAPRMNHQISIIFAMIVFWGLQAPDAIGQDEQSVGYQLEPGSRLWLKGSATIGEYECSAGTIVGSAKLRADSLSSVTFIKQDTAKSEARVTVIVKDLD